MFKNIGIENFRIFKGYTEFEIAPITLLSGPNNSGKSSFLKLLDLLKFSFGTKNSIDRLNFENIKNSLGTFENSLNWKNQSDVMKFVFDFPLDEFEEKFKLELIYEKVEEDGEICSFRVFNEENNLFSYILTWRNYDGIIKPSDDFYIYYSVNFKYLKRLIKSNNPLFFNYYKKDVDENLDLNESYYDILELFENEYLSKKYYMLDYIPQFRPDLFEDLIEETLNFGDFNELFHGFDSKNNEDIKNIQYDINFKFSEQDFESFKEEIDNIGYSISKDHSDIYEKYIKKNILKGIEKLKYSFNNIANISAFRGSKYRVLGNNSYSEIDGIIKQYLKMKSEGLDKNKYDSFLKESFDLLGIKGTLNLKRIEGASSVLYIDLDEKKINLSDLGFGYSQIIPILLKIIVEDHRVDNQLRVNPHGLEDIKEEQEKPKDLKEKISNHENDVFEQLFELFNIEKKTKYPTIVIEEPEANLHPNLQSKLADVLVLAHKTFGIHFILETHSEYLVRKLQYLTASKEINPGDVNIYYFNADEYVSKEEPKVKKIQIDKFGALSDHFGPGFFDEATTLKFDLMKLNKEQRN